VYHGTATADHLVASFSVSGVEPLGAENFVGNCMFMCMYMYMKYGDGYMYEIVPLTLTALSCVF